MNKPVTIEIWSDIICPFCYIGKRKFEEAIKQLPADYQLSISWKSFQLAPDMETDTSISIDQYLAKHKGFPIEKAKEMNAYVTEMAKAEGLTFNFDKAIVANTFLAHQFLHYAKTQGKQYEAKELLFKAYFTEGKNVDSISTLIEIANQLEFNVEEVIQAINSNQFANDVDKDIFDAQQIGVRGVPFFVVNRTHAISGAQPVDVILETIKQAVEHATISNVSQENNVCDIDGNC
jgi:predicted DsbA family dithiol-disulfide isomerase